MKLIYLLLFSILFTSSLYSQVNCYGEDDTFSLVFRSESTNQESYQSSSCKPFTPHTETCTGYVMYISDRECVYSGGLHRVMATTKVYDTVNNDSCPPGQTPNADNVCEAPTDDDGNGVPDSEDACNPAHSLYATSDCDEDGESNGDDDTPWGDSPPVTCGGNEYLDANATCQSRDDAIPDDFPSDATSNGKQSSGTLPITKESCEEKKKTDTYLGYYQPIAWDYANGKCIAVAFKCTSGRVLNKEKTKCIVPPDNKEFPTGEDNICPNNNWAKKRTHDFCNLCTGSVGIWYPPIGHKDSGMECNKQYVEYNCVSDFRVKKYQQTSCGTPLPEDTETRDLNITKVTSSITGDSNSSNLPTATAGEKQTSEQFQDLIDAIKGLDLNASANAFSSSGFPTPSDDLVDEDGNYKENSGQVGNRESIDGTLSGVYTTFTKMKTDYTNIKTMLDSGVHTLNLSSGSDPKWCTTVFGKPFCIDLCKSFGLFKNIFYYIFTLMFLLTAVKLYYSAFKMR